MQIDLKLFNGSDTCFKYKINQKNAISTSATM